MFLSGSAAVGKTNLRYSLLGQSFVKEYESTLIQETKHAYVTNAGIIESEKGGKSWNEFNLEKQINYFRSLWKNKSLKNPNEDDEDNPISEIRKKLITNGSTNLPKEIKIQEPLKMISIIDTGGQPGYIHMLPAIIYMLPAIKDCVTINFVVIDMTKELDDNVLVRYRKKGEKEKINQFHYTNKDLIKLLLSVSTDYSLNIQKLATSNQETKNSKVCIGFIGTHKDILEKEKDTKKIHTLDQQLTELVNQQNCKSFMIKPKLDREYLYPLSNKTPNDQVVLKVRNDIERLLENVETMKLPINWMILELTIKLHCSSKEISYITYQKFLEIATDEKLIQEEEEAKEALLYFHSHGIFLYFEEIPKMCDYVIVEHQWLYDQLSKLVTVSPENPLCADDFSHGILPKSELPKIEGGLTTEENIEMEDLISLLDHKKILACYIKNNVEYYYLPFALPYCQQYTDNIKFLLIEPLLIRFSSGVLPRGFFCSLVVHFLQDTPPGWRSLHDKTDRHFRNVMTFFLPNDLYLRLQDKIYYLEIQVRHYQHCNAKCMLEELQVLCGYIYKVCETLRFDYSKLQFGFICQHAKWDENGHMAVFLEPLECNSESCNKCENQVIALPFINDSSLLKLIFCEICGKQLYCEKCQKSTAVGELHKLWFKKEVTDVTTYVRS